MTLSSTGSALGYRCELRSHYSRAADPDTERRHAGGSAQAPHGSATWTTVAGVGAAVDKAGSLKLYSGFALDATHVWLGGDAGLLMHN